MNNDRDAIKARMESSFVPNDVVGTHNVEPPLRVAHALEYIAFQMGQINKSLARIAERLDAKD